ncbi:MAG: 2-phospho-L-lactate transferase [Xanthomonadales bacterium]|nr:2-phospho-L-lactate transferase [Xanthomonadales bacterium]
MPVRPAEIVVLSGGIGGVKLVQGFAETVDPGTLWVFVNTGDDFDHLGLRVCPDLDTTLYTLSGLADPERGWGRRDETWQFIEAVKGLGGPDWFRLGDRDLALNVLRSDALRSGRSLSEFIDAIRRRLAIDARVLPMSDDDVRTRVDTQEGRLSFQEYFVGRQCRPVVERIVFAGAASARPQPELLEKLASPQTRAVIIAPSNPYLSIDPILALPGVPAALRGCPAPVLAVSPIVGGDSVKGPTAKIMRELSIPVSAAAVAAHYGDWLDGFVLDRRDADRSEGIDVPVRVCDTLMHTLDVKRQLARELLAFADELGRP